MKSFLNSHPNVVLVPIDKSKNLVFMNKTDYHEKLYKTFTDNPDRFSELNEYDVQKECSKLNEVIECLKPVCNKETGSTLSGYVDYYTFKKMRPKQKAKNAYGLIKVHKNNKIRPIVRGINCVTTGVEVWLKSLLSPITRDLKFSLNSTKEFKNVFETEKLKFDPKKHTVVSFDAVSLFTNINVPRVIDYAVKKIYEDPNLLNYQNTYRGKTTKLEKIPADTLKNIFITILTDFNSFLVGEKIFQQNGGLVMGNFLPFSTFG